MTYSISIEQSKQLKTKPADETLGFGKYYTDHMFILDYTAEQGWHSPRIIPYQPISLDPAAKIFHYGQSVFEGLKAYRAEDGRLLLFRPDRNFKRLNISNARLSIPALDEQFALEALIKLLEVDQDWIPHSEGTSLYIRPFVIATESALGVAPSLEYKFMIILSPVGSYYAEGIHPVKIYVEPGYVRAVTGGVGNAKTAGNYAAGLKAQEEATEKGYSQVLWLDGVHKKFIEEVGSMNVFFKINGTVITPVLNGSILEGITRSSILELLEHMNIPVEQRQLSMEEVYQAYQDGTLEEAFGTGTAAVISPIGELNWRDEKIIIQEGRTGELAATLYHTLTSIQHGRIEGPAGWVVEIPQLKKA
ncbi:branched-chain amino acid aminotransferase [Paenibacillus shirakamiensis]|uniref:Branched-chain-amino-acid aminotransferase n=1 Tax=Paenibacillus shirakamiensis TaxID=1265935 RepID=A0ABS4JH25_9BACL|nr:branched-chain amino acid aminotransferase [Paenibacillus shirakamiensis]MBP2001020.1 branched-chain amino acid aminotransferase [Paenibacillus shirakamiensis]